LVCGGGGVGGVCVGGGGGGLWGGGVGGGGGLWGFLSERNGLPAEARVTERRNAMKDGKKTLGFPRKG